MSIIITTSGKQAQRLDKSNFDAEDNLQQYIFDNPESLPLYEIKEDIRLLILAREFDTDSGPIDAIGVDKEGEIYVIETKLYKNPDKRTVVAQVLDYGASLWRHVDRPAFLEAAEESARTVFGCDLNTKLINFFNITTEESVQLLKNVADNLNSGTFRFVVLMDMLHDRLKDLVVFLNANTRFSIYAVEMEYYKFAKYEIVIPKLFGGETKKDIALSSGGSIRRRWDERSFFESAQRELSAEELKAVRQFYVWSQNRSTNITWGTGSTGSFNPKFSQTGVRSPFSVYCDGRLNLNFDYIDENAQDFRERWVKELAQKLRLSVTPETKYKSFAKSDWISKIYKFTSVFDELLDDK